MRMRTKKDAPEITIGTVVFTKTKPQFIGEVYNIIEGRHDQFELLLYDKRLKPIMRGDGTFRRKRFRQEECRVLDQDFKMTTTTIELGDIICKKQFDRFYGTKNKYGVVVGFTHPDGLLSTSYMNGYNGTDLIDCVEIEKRGLARKRDAEGELKRFSTFSDRLSCCEIDLWNKTGPKIISKK